MKAGDVLIGQKAEDSWSVVKILAIDEWPDNSQVFHCMFYEPSPGRPTAETIESLNVVAWHAPMAAQAYRSGWEVLCSTAVRDRELGGFHEYLKLTDFSRYATATSQDMRSLVSQANELYRRACALGEAGERQSAIDLYTRAIDTFPLFYEAIDNRAFTYMELGDFAAALRGFEESLRVNPIGNAAFFSRGECLMKLGLLDKATAAFKEGAARFPEHRDLYVRFLTQSRMKAQGPSASSDLSSSEKGDHAANGSRQANPWWKFWRR
ncbi:tetratricopeptide repeat protein [Dyella tabacisoli]|uniref:Tetratricopeptide repeat protein n=1 Tax=Dyella tabacisoli TaxID=2282381 RepID=A0A369UKC1_9GAMM|nr:tetratricopeptide repeat protein [Dyella tabacisoli]RDD80040.1 tetratricopeptide repeat protein [Dyella tabacisoli]